MKAQIEFQNKIALKDSNSRPDSAPELEAALRKSEARFQNLIENLQVGVVIHGPDTAILFANRMATQILGLTQNKLQGMYSSDPLWRFIREDGSPMPLKDFPVSRVCSSLKPIKNQIVGSIRPDETSPIWALCNAHPEFDDSGKLLQIVVNFTDISEQKILKEELNELELLFQTAMNQSPVGIAIADAKTKKIRYLNQAGFLLKGGNPTTPIQEMNVNSLTEFWEMLNLDGTPINASDLPIERALSHGERTSREYILRHPGYEERVIWLNSAPVRRSDQATIAATTVFIDTTERHQLMKELQVAREVAEYANLSKSHFLDVAAHELRTPVAIFSALLQLTETQLEKGKAVEPSTLKRLRAQVERISRLVVDLLDVSRLEHGILKLTLDRTDLLKTLTECIEDFKIRFPNRNIAFSRPDITVPIKMDSTRIYQVISNLLDNASKYSPAESTIEVSLEDAPLKARISITDHGPGVPYDQQAILFMPFSRGSTEISDRSTGLGLGLYISRRIIELHHGTIGLTSKSGEGSTFFFEIPKEEIPK